MQSRGSLTIRTFRVCRPTPAVTWANSSERATDTSDGGTTDPSRRPTFGLPRHLDPHYNLLLLATGDIWNNQV